MKSDRLQAMVQRLRAENPEKTPEQLDAEHDAWRNTNDGLAAIIKRPNLGKPPSERTWPERRAIILEEIELRNRNEK